MTHEQFVRIWQTASSYGAALSALGIEEGQARNIAAAMRRAGVPLRTWPRGRCRYARILDDRLDVLRLRQLIIDIESGKMPNSAGALSAIG